MSDESHEEVFAGLERAFAAGTEAQAMEDLSTMAKRLGHYREELIRHGVVEADSILEAYHLALVGLNVGLLSL